VAGAPAEVAEALEAEGEGVLRLARISRLEQVESLPVGDPGAHAVLRSGAEVFLPLEGIVDLDRERERIVAEIERLRGLLDGARNRLSNDRFVKQAPPEVVQREKDKCLSLQDRLGLLEEKREAFGSD
jgi:valyl-tRNA synthetase